MPALDNLEFEIAVWSDDGNRILEVLARTAKLEYGYAVFQAAVLSKPNDYIIFRRGAHVLRERMPAIEPMPKAR